MLRHVICNVHFVKAKCIGCQTRKRPTFCSAKRGIFFAEAKKLSTNAEPSSGSNHRLSGPLAAEATSHRASLDADG